MTTDSLIQVRELTRRFGAFTASDNVTFDVPRGQIFQWITMLVPANYAVQIIRGIVLRGATVAQLWQPILWLSVYTIVIVGLAVLRFKKTSA